jgi:hypothetical protein
MTKIETLKNNLIDQILSVKNEKLLKALSNMLQSLQSDEEVSLDSDQLEMMYMSEKDIETGNLISETDIKLALSEWEQ